MRARAVVLAVAIVLAPLGAKAADLVVWWEEGFYAEEDEAVREIIAAFEQKTGKQVELVFHSEEELPDKIVAAFEGGQPPDFAFGLFIGFHIGQWAFDDRLVDLSDAIGHFSDLFDPDVLSWELLLNASTGKGPCTGCRWAVRPTTSTSGRASSSERASPSRTSRRSGTLSGPFGATRCSRPCAKPWAATTSGASGCPWRSGSTPGMRSSSSWRPTRRIT